MYNIVLFDEKSTVRVLEKALSYFADETGLRVTNDAIWLDGLYLKFHPRLVTVNTYNTARFPPQRVLKCLHHIFKGEEIYVSGTKENSVYIDCVNSPKQFGIFFSANS